MTLLPQSDFNEQLLRRLIKAERAIADLQGIELAVPAVAAAGGGLVKIETQIITVATQFITFSSIVQTHSHLLFTVQARSDGAAVHQTLALRFNSDSGSNYEWTTRSTDISSGAHPWLVSESTSDSRLRPGIFAGGSDAGAIGRGIILLLNYRNTNFDKHAQGWGSVNQESGTNPRAITDIGGGVWHNIAAITKVEFGIFPTARKYDVDSEITMYGIA